MLCCNQLEDPSALFTALQSMVRDEAYDPEASYAIARERRETAMADIEELLGRDSIEYGPLNYRTAARTLFLRPYLAHFCPVFSRFFAIFSVLTPGFQKVAPKDRGAVP